MASYQQNVDPQSFVSGPYQLPVPHILAAVKSRQDYWDLGASQLKNTYNRFLNLNVTLDQNKTQLDTLMKNVDSGLKSAVRSDLSIAPNVNDAMKIFDPVIKNENIMGDHAITSHYQKELQLADTYRTKDGGKEYHAANVQYLMQGLDKFSKSANPNSWKEHFAQRRAYVPFHDVSAEVRELIKTFKPSSESTTVPDIDPKTGKYKSYYSTTSTDKSVRENQLKAYLSANLSDKAKQQLRINGSVSYYNDPGQARTDYTGLVDQRIETLNQQKKIIQGQIKASSDIGFKEQRGADLGEIEDQIKDYQRERSNAQSDEYLGQNFDQITQMVYSDKFISNLARGNARTDVEVTMKPDMVALTMFKEEMDNKRFNKRLEFDFVSDALEREHETSLATIRSSAKKKEEEDALFKPSTQTAKESNNQTYGRDFLNQKYKAANEDISKANSRIRGEIEMVTGEDLDKMQKAERDAFISQWVRENSGKNPAIDEYYKSVKVAQNTKAVLNEIEKTATDEVKRLHPGTFDVANTTVVPLSRTIPTRTGGYGHSVIVNLTKQDVLDVRQGKSNKIKLYQKGTGSGREGVGTTYLLEYNGKTHEIGSGEYINLQNAISPNKGAQAEIDQSKNKILNSSVTAIREERTPEGVDQNKATNLVTLRNDFRRITGMKQEAFKDINVYSIDKNGASFSIPSVYGPEEMGISHDTLEEIIRRRNGTKNTTDGITTYHIPYNNLSWQPISFTDPELAPLNDYYNFQKAFNITRGKLDLQIRPPKELIYDPNHINENIQISMDLQAGVPRYFIFMPDYKKKIGDLQTGGGFASLEDAAVQIKDMTKNKALFQEYIKRF